MLDSLIFAPKTENCDLSNNKLAARRLQQLHQGHIQDLYKESRSIPPKQHSSHDQDTAQRLTDMAAQLAADEDNYHTAYARITNSQAVAELTPENVARCQKLYVPKTS